MADYSGHTMLISVAIATYNGDRFLQAQLDSLYAQTHLPDEVVVCDDCSTDGTASILEAYHQKYGLIYHVNERQLGVNANFFKAMSLCKGDFISICDQDDVWLPNKIETLYNHLVRMNQDVPCVVSSMRKDIDKQGNEINVLHGGYTEGWKATLLTYGRNQGCTMMMNKQVVATILAAIKNIPNALTDIYYDEWIAYTAAILGEKHNLPDVLMEYRHHDANVVDQESHYGKLSFRQKVSYLPTFYGFIPDERFLPLEIVYDAYRERITDIELVDFLCKIKRCNQCPNRFRQLGIILSMHCLTGWQKLQILCKSTGSIILKRVIL